MAMTQARLPAPLRLKPASISLLSTADAHTSIKQFLDLSAANDLLAGSGVVRSALLRLVAGLKEELDAAPLSYSVAATKVEDGAVDKTKKRRKSEGGKGADGEGKKKKRKVAA
ncbi:hypothetical protein JCM11251_004293 [Rhodosporidiobolus azoricus]